MSWIVQPQTKGNLHPAALPKIGLGVLGIAGALLIWGTGFDGRSFGPVRFLLAATPHGDKVGHFVLYGAITFAVVLLARRPVPAAVGAFAVFAVGTADEFRQLGVGGRNFDLLDIAANSVGVCAGLAAGALVLHHMLLGGQRGSGRQYHELEEARSKDHEQQNGDHENGSFTHGQTRTELGASQRRG